MKRLKKLLNVKRKPIRILTVFALCALLTACGNPGTPGTPGGSSAKQISAGFVLSLTAVQASLQTLVPTNPGLQPELNYVTTALGIAKLVNNDVQAGTFTAATDANITALGQLAGQIASQFGANASIVVAINVGVALFEQIRTAFKPTTTGAVKSIDVKAEQAKLDKVVKQYQKMAAAVK